MLKVYRLVLFSIFVLFSTQVLAEGYAVYEWGARGVALGGTTVARTPDPSVLASNPAAATGLDGINLQLGTSLIKPFGEIEFYDPLSDQKTYKPKDKVWVMPSIYYTQKINENIYVGIGEFTRFGLGFKYPQKWPGSRNIYEIALSSASINPNLILKLNDSFSFAFGVEVMYLDVVLKKYIHKGTIMANGQTMPTGLDTDLHGDSIGVGFNVGFHYILNDQWAFGLAFRSDVLHNIKADAKVTPDESGYLPTAKYKDQDAEAILHMPESLTVGVAWSPVKEFSLEMDVTWTRWSRFNELEITFDHLPSSITEKRWRDAWRIGIGAEYYPLDWLATRIGYVWDGCPVNDDYEDYFIPTNGRNIYSLGLGFVISDWNIDVAYALVDANDKKYDRRIDDGIYESKSKNAGSHIVSLSVGYKF